MEVLIKEKIEIAPELLQQIEAEKEKQVIVHGIIDATANENLQVRVWPSIFLLPKDSDSKCRLLHHFNIAMYPEWQQLLANESLRFTLVFEGLPANCSQFDLVEIIPEPGGFEYRNITRNSLDVYSVKI